MSMGQWGVERPKSPDYTITAWYPVNRGGGVAIVTWHRSEASRDMEIAAFRSRMVKGEISHIEVTNLVPPFGSYRVYDYPRPSARDCGR